MLTPFEILSDVARAGAQANFLAHGHVDPCAILCRPDQTVFVLRPATGDKDAFAQAIRDLVEREKALAVAVVLQVVYARVGAADFVKADSGDLSMARDVREAVVVIVESPTKATCAKAEIEGGCLREFAPTSGVYAGRFGSFFPKVGAN